MLILLNLEVVDTEKGQDGEGWRGRKETSVDSDSKYRGNNKTRGCSLQNK